MSDERNAGDDQSDLVLDTLWNRTLEAWDEDKVHNALLDYALRAERLPEIAGRYRALKDDELKGSRAKKRIDAIVLAATQRMLSYKSPPKAKVPVPITVSAFFICAIMIGWTAYAIFRR